MSDTRLDRFLIGLEGTFEAALSAEDEAAAADLGFSLSQDIAVRDELLREGGYLRLSGERTRVQTVGHDFLIAGPWIVPTSRAVVELGGAASPEERIDVLLAVLRRFARAAAAVRVGSGGADEVQGRLDRANPDHVVIRTVSERLAIPLGEVRYLRLVRGGSVDAL